MTSSTTRVADEFARPLDPTTDSQRKFSCIFTVMRGKSARNKKLGFTVLIHDRQELYQKSRFFVMELTHCLCILNVSPMKRMIESPR